MASIGTGRSRVAVSWWATTSTSTWRSRLSSTRRRGTRRPATRHESDGGTSHVKRLLWIVGLPLFLAACGAPGGLYGSAPAASTAPSASTAPASTPSATAPAATVAPTSAPATAAASVIATQNARLGSILTNPQGRTLYYFLPERGGKIVCSS